MDTVSPGDRASRAAAKWSDAMSAACAKWDRATMQVTAVQWQDAFSGVKIALANHDWEEYEDWDEWQCTYCRSVNESLRCQECGAPKRQ